MKKVQTLRELQLINIAIYKDLRDFCNANGLKVYLTGGTLLGAVRHKGFIPWDDDIDVCMSRPDYERLLELSKGEISARCTIIDPEKSEDFNGCIPVAVYNNSLMKSGQYRTNENLKIGISIFVYDGVPENSLLQKCFYAFMYFLRAEHALCRADFAHVNTKPAKLFGPLLQPFYNERSIKKYKNKVLKLQKKYQYENSKYVSTNVDYQSSVEVCLKEEFEKSIELTFEGIKSLTYSHYLTYLRNYYGDYMQLPPLEEREGKHSFDAWIEDGFDYDSVTNQ